MESPPPYSLKSLDHFSRSSEYKNFKKLNGVGKESFAAMWIDHPFMIEGEKIRQRNILYLKAILVLAITISLSTLCF